MHVVETLDCGCEILYKRWHDDEPIRTSDDYYAVHSCKNHRAFEPRMFGTSTEARDTILGKKVDNVS